MVPVQVGEVHHYDAERGLGVVSGDGTEYAFHCTAIADGSRQIDAGTLVAFVLAPGHGGRYEASSLTKLSVPPV